MWMYKGPAIITNLAQHRRAILASEFSISLGKAAYRPTSQLNSSMDPLLLCTLNQRVQSEKKKKKKELKSRNSGTKITQITSFGHEIKHPHLLTLRTTSQLQGQSKHQNGCDTGEDFRKEMVGLDYEQTRCYKTQGCEVWLRSESVATGVNNQPASSCLI